MAQITHTAAPKSARWIASFLLMLGAVALSPIAHAQWQVHDTEVNNVLGSTSDGTINKNTKDTADRSENIRDRLTIGAYDDKKPGARILDPAVALPKAASSAALDNGQSCKSLNDKQQTICQQIIDIQNAQYKFMLTVYETSADRDTVLRELLTARSGIGEADYGKLEDNTNKLTALYNLIALDRQQMDSVNYAYNANVTYLTKKLALAAKAAQSGQTEDSLLGSVSIPIAGELNLDSLLGAVVTGAVLEGALKDAQSDEPSGMLHLSLEH